MHVRSNSQHVESSSSSAIDALSKRLSYALTMRLSQNFTDLAVDAIDGLVSISRRFRDLQPWSLSLRLKFG